MTKLKRASVERMGSFSYRIKHKDIPSAPDGGKRRGFILESEGEALIIPFKKSEGRRRTPHDIRRSEHGKLKLSAARQKVTVSITLDREQDSEEAFFEEFRRLVDGYVLDLLKFEIDQCLE